MFCNINISSYFILTTLYHIIINDITIIQFKNLRSNPFFFRSIVILLLLVHINPPVTDGNFKYDWAPVYSFASKAIFKSLAEMHIVQMLASAKGMFNAGVAPDQYVAVSAGILFEQICLLLKPLDWQLITAASLENSGSISFTMPLERHLLQRDWTRTSELSANLLIVPRISNLEPGNAFCLVQCDTDSYWLVVLQITVGESHPVKANELNEILRSFPENLRNKITRRVLLFVTPSYGPLIKKQTLQTQKNEPSVLLPGDVQSFEQFVYCHLI